MSQVIDDYSSDENFQKSTVEKLPNSIQ